MNKFRMKLGRYVLVCTFPLVLVACTAPQLASVGGIMALVPPIVPVLAGQLGIAPTVLTTVAADACATQKGINTVGGLVSGIDPQLAGAVSLASTIAGGLCSW